jgi:hypothetical protein
MQLDNFFHDKKGEIKNLSVQPRDLKWIIIARCVKIIIPSLFQEKKAAAVRFVHEHISLLLKAFMQQPRRAKNGVENNLIQIYLNAPVL